MKSSEEVKLKIANQKIEVKKSTLLLLYTSMLKSRMIEEKMLILLRQGKISKWFSGIGQEAIAVGVTLAMNEDEYILPMHRNLGVFPSLYNPRKIVVTSVTGFCTRMYIQFGKR